MTARPSRLHRRQPEIANLNRPIIGEEDIVRLHISVNDILRMQVAARERLCHFIHSSSLLHSLGGLFCDVDYVAHAEFGSRFVDVQMLIETRTLAPLSDNRKIGLSDPTHEQQHVHVTSLPANKDIHQTPPNS